MMMPANFSVVAENEMTYVVGGGVIEAIGSVTAPIWTAANVKTFNTNLVTIIGNSYLNNFVGNTLGAIFCGTYTPGDVLGNFGSDISAIWHNNYFDGSTKEKVLTGMKGVLNVGLNIAGNLAAIYNLGFGTVKNKAESAGIPAFEETMLL